MLAFADWSIHLMAAPGKRLELALLAANNLRRLIQNLAGGGAATCAVAG